MENLSNIKDAEQNILLSLILDEVKANRIENKEVLSKVNAIDVRLTKVETKAGFMGAVISFAVATSISLIGKLKGLS